jgi:hypothetical protein
MRDVASSDQNRGNGFIGYAEFVTGGDNRLDWTMHQKIEYNGAGNHPISPAAELAHRVHVPASPRHADLS